MDAIDLDGPTFAPATGGPARALVLLLHGYGADGADLMPLAAAWRQALPSAAFLMPDAPDPCDVNPFGRQWFPLAGLERAAAVRGIAAVAPRVERYVARQLAAFELQPRRLAIAGFSQGAVLALDLGLRRLPSIAGIVSFSGLLASAPAPRPEPYPPVFLAHGSADPVVPFAAMAAAERELAAAAVPVQRHVRNGLGHGIDEAEIALAARFLEAVLAA